MTTRDPKLKFFLVGLIFSGLTIMAVGTPKAFGQEVEPVLTAPLRPLRSGLTGDGIFTQLLAHNKQRKAGLVGYTSLRTYKVVDMKGKVHAEEIGRMEFRAPDKKKFVVIAESGSTLVRHLALHRLIASEIEAATGKGHHESAITPDNYTLIPLGQQQVGRYGCLVVQAVPKRRDTYLFEGRIWIDAKDYAVVRIEGHPAKHLSFWIERADFVRQYQKIGGFWLPKRDETFVHVRLYGKKALTIDHRDYVVNGAKPSSESLFLQTARTFARTSAW